MRTPEDQLPGARVFIALTLLACAVFLPAAVSAGFLNYDDDYFFGARNAVLRDGGLVHVWNPTRTIANAYLPVSHTSLWLDWQLFGRAPLGPHLHSLLLHVLAAFVLARLLARVGLGKWAACAASALFLVHPALTESVVWVASRKDVLSGLFSFLCLSAVVRDRPRSAVGWALLALYSKATAIVLPLVALPIVWSRVPRRWGTPAALAVVAAGAGTHHALLAAREGTLVTTGLAARLAQVPGAFLHYLETAVWPSGLNVVYPEIETLESFRAALLPGLLVLAALVAAVLLLRKRRPLAAAGLAAFVIALAPFNTALPASSAAAADRYLYLAIPGLALALVGLGPRIGPWLAAAAVVPLAVLAADRAHDFRTSESLWRASLAQNPRNAVAAINLAIDRLARRPGELAEVRTLLERAADVARYPQHELRAEMLLVGVAETDGRLEAAVDHAARAVAVLGELPAGPATDRARIDVLLAAARQARLADDGERADRWLADARRLAPDDPTCLAFAASTALSRAVGEGGRIADDDPVLDEVRAMLERAGATPGAAQSYALEVARAELAAATGEFMAAEKHYRRAIALVPARPEAHLGRAQVYLGRGLFPGAERAVREALAAGVTDPRLEYLLGLALGGQGRLDDARKFYEGYLLGRPHDRAARLALAAVLASQAMRDLYRLPPEQLDALADRIEEYDPANPKAAVVRAVACRHRHELDAALVLLERAREALGADDEELRRLYAETLRDRGYECFLREPDRRAAAFDWFRRFLDAARGTEVPIEAVENIVLQEWLRLYEEGRYALADGELDRAERALRRCLFLRPGDPQPRLQLGLLLYKRGGDALEEALAAFRAYGEGQSALDRDPTVGVLYEVQTLRRLERYEDALAVADAFLARASDTVATEPDVARLQAARDAVADRLGR